MNSKSLPTFHFQDELTASCRKHRPLLDHAYFAASAPGRAASDQFFCFINLANWMLHGFGGLSTNPVREGDDPQAAIRALLSALGQLNFAVPPSCTVARLQSGAGREVCAVLDALADWSLEKCNFVFAPPMHEGNATDGCASCWPRNKNGPITDKCNFAHMRLPPVHIPVAMKS